MNRKYLIFFTVDRLGLLRARVHEHASRQGMVLWEKNHKKLSISLACFRIIKARCGFAIYNDACYTFLINIRLQTKFYM